MSIRRRYSPEKRREQLINLVIDSFADMGIERAGHGDVAKRAGISTATVFNYFPTKEALTQEGLEEIRKRILDMFDTLPQNHSGPREQLLSLYSNYQMMILAHPSTIKTYLAWSVSFNPNLRPKYIEMQKLITGRIIDNMPEGLKTHADALIAYNAANLIAVMIYDNQPAEILQEFVTRLVDAILPQAS